MGTASGRIGGLAVRLARHHERRPRDSFAEAAPLLLRLVVRLRAPEPLPTEAMRLFRSLLGNGAGPLYARSAHHSEYPPGTLSRLARAILVVCDHRVPWQEPGELVRS